MAEVNRCDRFRGSLWGMFVGDALAMPAHWYYDVAALKRDFGELRDYRAPTTYHPSSIMSLASTGSAGRGSQQGNVVGSVILHGKKHLWGRPNQHYHHGLQRGDNTLNLRCARVLLRSMNTIGRYDSDDFLREYIAFMTTPGTHDDTYAESYHREFFARFSQGYPPERCAGEENHDTASIGGLVTLPPVILAAVANEDANTRDEMLLRHLRLTHRSAKLEPYALALGRLMQNIVEERRVCAENLFCSVAESFGFPASRVVHKMKCGQRSDLEVIGRLLSPACYIDQSFPAVLYLAARYSNDFEEALVANANVGGDNCHRGAVLGGILGAALGFDAIPDRWIHELRSRTELEREIEAFVAQFA
jgi:ADP-ribosyl-[dinitrogen reductase] hydrolase